MNIIALTVLFASTAVLAIAQDNNSGLAIPHSDWRKELLSSYVFEQPRKVLPSASRPPVSVSTGPDDQAAVKLPEFIVRDSTINMFDLSTAILQSKAAAKTADFDSKLGIGVHELRESRVTLYAVTIFCIPVTLGIAW
jgi:hypothetical protein